MNSPITSSMCSLLFLFLFSFSLASSASAHTHENFLQCLSHYPNTTSNISQLIYTQTNSSYASVLNFSIRNPRFSSSSTPKPLVIITPVQLSHIQAAINCSRKHGMQVRIRSGGHDYEGLSYVSQVPFVVIDLINLRSITVDVDERTAWIESGATIGEVYYRIAEKIRTLGFPAGVCPTVGVGGHFGGGGYGTMLRKYGLSADNVIDAHIVDVNGRFLDRQSMGEDLFWAIRGGGGASFGVVLAWKVKLVPVPSTVTVFSVNRNLEQNVTQLVHRWQYVADKFDEDLFVRIILQSLNASAEGKRTIQASFNSLFLGGVDRLIPLMEKSFPELGLTKEDCTEMSWIESTLYFNGFSSGESLDVLLDRTPSGLIPYKAKSDYVKEPIPEEGLEGLWEKMHEETAGRAILIFSPYGGKMDEISESEIPFPHRVGNIYKIQHLIYWEEEGDEAAQRHISWMRKLYAYMTPYVSKNPRAAYMNYRDLDIGTNRNGITSYTESSIWGIKYFKNNFNRLVHVKTMVDPTNFFRHEQSVPPLSSRVKKIGN
ncbi:tetrahydroberberine oxidase-like [Ziziphus jujuba]|uniref:Tetrahydroberberine oxidase-like n=1 Tax=Ziziphus jujuba TaxID=326968 RepID=A0ABM3IFW6_ZIZJJ|nr:tetrahydroberberine oxidase-like [Ziziphus jujuba]